MNKTRRNLCLTLLLLCCVTMLHAQIPAGYYDKADGKKAAALKAALTECIVNHTWLAYSSLWDYYPLTDVVIGTEDQIRDLYSNDVHYFSDYSGMNKEHTVPKSWWGGSTSNGAGSDIHHVIPSEQMANSRKSNYPLGRVRSSDWSNGVTTIGTSAVSGYTGKVFEPADRYKGDFARMYFYVATCYPDIWESDAYAMENTSSTLKPWIISMLLDWNRNDPVDASEIKRNDAVFGVQKNRNPFIDYPELADYIWGSKAAETFYLAAHIPTTSEDYTPGNPDTPTTPDNPDTPVTPDDPTHSEDDILLFEDFAELTSGNNYATSGSSASWSGNDNFPTVTNCFQAGEAVKIGSSKSAGSITSRPLTHSGSKLIVELDVKGWTSVEGQLRVSAGDVTQTLEYTTTMTQSFEHLKVELDDVPSPTTVTFATTAKRVYLDNIKIYQNNITGIATVAAPARSYYVNYSLDGRRVGSDLRQLPKGVYIVNSKWKEGRD